jgi:hypothetical protein
MPTRNQSKQTRLVEFITNRRHSKSRWILTPHQPIEKNREEGKKHILKKKSSITKEGSVFSFPISSPTLTCLTASSTQRNVRGLHWLSLIGMTVRGTEHPTLAKN